MLGRTTLGLVLIAACANSCGDMERVPDCFDDFGKPSFPACGGDDDGADDGADE